MPKAKYDCPNCGASVLKARWEAGYEYCKDRKCFEALGRKKVALYEKPPEPGEVDIDPYELDDVAQIYGNSD